MLRPFLLRREKKDVEEELPKKTESVIKVELSAWQKVVYNYITDYESNKLTQSSQKQGNIMMNNIIMQQRKICNHPYIFLESYMETDELISSSGKIELLDRIVPKLL